MNALMILVGSAALLISACSATGQDGDMPATSSTSGAPSEAQYSPRPGDDLLTRGRAFIDSTDLRTQESYPLQFTLNIKGNLPTPCSQLRAQANPPDQQGIIGIEVYSVADPDRICAQVLSPFEINLPLGSYPPGKYEIQVNGEKVAELISS